jgi:putative endonuclease
VARSIDARRSAYRRGHFAEIAALALLTAKGYRFVARRYSAAGGEIDLIMRRRETIVFVEVKARALLDDAQGAINAAKRRRFSRAVRAWLAQNPWAGGHSYRADAVFVAPRHLPCHLEQAFVIEGL